MEKVSVAKKVLTALSGFSGFTAYGVIFGTLLVCGLGVPIPEDITLIAAGLLAGIGNISLTGALVVGFFGVLAGDAFLFFLGRRLGNRVFLLPVFRRIFTPERIEPAKARILRNSKFICFTARFLPGLRSAVFLTAGIMGVRPIVFLALDGLAALLSVPLWVALGYWFGRKISQDAAEVDDLLQVAKRFNGYIIAALILLVGGYFTLKYYRRRRHRSSSVNPPS